MAQSRIDAQVRVSGPVGLQNVARRIQQGLSNISAKVDVKISSSATNNVNNFERSLNKLNATLQTTARYATTAAQGLKSISNSMQGGAANLNKTASAANNASKSITKTAKGTQELTNQVAEFGRVSGLAVRRFAGFSIATGIIFGFIRAMTTATKEALDFNHEMVKISQVTGTSVNSLKSLQNQITSLATGLGVSSTDLLKISRILTQTGLSAKDTAKALESLAKSELAPTFTNIEQTAEGAVAIMRQFNIGAGDLEKALGSVNAVSAKFAVESDDIIQAVRRAGGAFAASSVGVSEGTDALNEFIATFTSVRATTRESAESIATGLRTIFTRVQRPRTIQALEELGIKLTDLDNKFIGPFKAINNIAFALEKIDPRDRRFAQIAEELGGFRQISKVIPLLQQTETRLNALKVAQEGQNSLTEDAAKAQQSLLIQFTKVREEFGALIRDITQTDTFQALAKTVLEIARAFISLASAVKPLIPIISAFAAIKLGSSLTQFLSGFGSGARGGKASPGGFSIGLANLLGPGRFNQGGVVSRNNGGLIPGRGPNKDSVYAHLTPGEFVIQRPAVDALGTDYLNAINRNRGGSIPGFATGGIKLTGRGIAEGNVGRKKQFLQQRVGLLRSGLQEGLLSPEEIEQLRTLEARLKHTREDRTSRFSKRFGFGFNRGGLMMLNPGSEDVVKELRGQASSNLPTNDSLLKRGFNTATSEFNENKILEDIPNNFAGIFLRPGNYDQTFDSSIQIPNISDFKNKVAGSAINKTTTGGALKGKNHFNYRLHLKSPTEEASEKLETGITTDIIDTIKNNAEGISHQFGMANTKAVVDAGFLKNINIDNIVGNIFEGVLVRAGNPFDDASGSEVSIKRSSNANFDFPHGIGANLSKIYGSSLTGITADAKASVNRDALDSLDKKIKTFLSNKIESKLVGELSSSAKSKSLTRAFSKSDIAGLLGLSDTANADALEKKAASLGYRIENIGRPKGNTRFSDNIDLVPLNSGGPAEVNAMLTKGEYVLQKKAVDAIGIDGARKLNNAHKYHTGGFVGRNKGGGLPGFVRGTKDPFAEQRQKFRTVAPKDVGTGAISQTYQRGFDALEKELRDANAYAQTASVTLKAFNKSIAAGKPVAEATAEAYKQAEKFQRRYYKTVNNSVGGRIKSSVKGLASRYGAVGTTGAILAAGQLQQFADRSENVNVRGTAGAFSGAAAGAALGSAFGPWGIAIGGAVGALNGFIDAAQNAREELAQKELTRASDNLSKAFTEFEKSGSIEGLNSAFEQSSAAALRYVDALNGKASAFGSLGGFAAAATNLPNYLLGGSSSDRYKAGFKGVSAELLGGLLPGVVDVNKYVFNKTSEAVRKEEVDKFDRNVAEETFSSQRESLYSARETLRARLKKGESVEDILASTPSLASTYALGSDVNTTQEALRRTSGKDPLEKQRILQEVGRSAAQQDANALAKEEELRKKLADAARLANAEIDNLNDRMDNLSAALRASGEASALTTERVLENIKNLNAEIPTFAAAFKSINVFENVKGFSREAVDTQLGSTQARLRASGRTKEADDVGNAVNALFTAQTQLPEKLEKFQDRADRLADSDEALELGKDFAASLGLGPEITKSIAALLGNQLSTSSRQEGKSLRELIESGELLKVIEQYFEKPLSSASEEVKFHQSQLQRLNSLYQEHSALIIQNNKAFLETAKQQESIYSTLEGIRGDTGGAGLQNRFNLRVTRLSAVGGVRGGTGSTDASTIAATLKAQQDRARAISEEIASEPTIDKANELIKEASELGAKMSANREALQELATSNDRLAAIQQDIADVERRRDLGQGTLEGFAYGSASDRLGFARNALAGGAILSGQFLPGEFGKGGVDFLNQMADLAESIGDKDKAADLRSRARTAPFLSPALRGLLPKEALEKLIKVREEDTRRDLVKKAEDAAAEQINASNLFRDSTLTFVESMTALTKLIKETIDAKAPPEKIEVDTGLIAPVAAANGFVDRKGIIHGKPGRDKAGTLIVGKDEGIATKKLINAVGGPDEFMKLNKLGYAASGALPFISSGYTTGFIDDDRILLDAQQQIILDRERARLDKEEAERAERAERERDRVAVPKELSDSQRDEARRKTSTGEIRADVPTIRIPATPTTVGGLYEPIVTDTSANIDALNANDAKKAAEEAAIKRNALLARGASNIYNYVSGAISTGVGNIRKNFIKGSNKKNSNPYKEQAEALRKNGGGNATIFNNLRRKSEIYERESRARNRKSGDRLVTKKDQDALINSIDSSNLAGGQEKLTREQIIGNRAQRRQQEIDKRNARRKALPKSPGTVSSTGVASGRLTPDQIKAKIAAARAAGFGAGSSNLLNKQIRTNRVLSDGRTLITYSDGTQEIRNVSTTRGTGAFTPRTSQFSNILSQTPISDATRSGQLGRRDTYFAGANQSLNRLRDQSEDRRFRGRVNRDGYYGFNTGGPVNGRSGTDTIKALLTRGEYVVNAGAASRPENRKILDYMNSRKAPTKMANGTPTTKTPVGSAFNFGGMADAVKTAADSLNKLVSGLSALKIPEKIEMATVIEHNININGAEAFAQLKDSFGKIAQDIVVTEMKKHIDFVDGSTKEGAGQPPISGKN